MPVFIAALLGGLYSAVGSFVGQALISLGIGYVVYRGFDVAMDWFKAETFSHLAAASSIAPQVMQFAGVLQVGTCLNILFSAWVARLAVQGIKNGAIKRMVQK